MRLCLAFGVGLCAVMANCAPTQTSALSQNTTTDAQCSAEDGPATYITLQDALVRGQGKPFSPSDAFDAMNKNGDDVVTSLEINDYAMEPTNPNATVVVSQVLKLAKTADRKFNLTRAEYNDAMAKVLDHQFVGCAGLCDKVEAKLQSCNFFINNSSTVANLTSTNSTDKRHSKQQQEAKFLLASCRLGSPDFSDFGNCIIATECAKIPKCFSNVRRCTLSYCTLADIAVTSDTNDQGNSAGIVISHDTKAISAERKAHDIGITVAAIASSLLFVATTAFVLEALGVYWLLAALFFFVGSMMATTRQAHSVSIVGPVATGPAQ